MRIIIYFNSTNGFSLSGLRSGNSMPFPAALGSALKKEGGCGRCYDEDKHNLSKNRRVSEDKKTEA